MYSMRGADLVIRLLERQGLDCICGIPGGAILPLYDALSRSTRIRHVLARHEQGAGFMAQGMARATGNAAVFFATSGPGATNVLTALADAKSDSVPVICITGQVSRALLGTDAFQEVDIYGMSIPVTKHNFLVRSAAELLKVIPEAFRIALSGRPGPVLIDIPRDVQLEAVELAEWPEPGGASQPPLPDAAALAGAVQMLNEARNPVLLLGGGAVASDAVPRIRALAEALNIPMTMSLMGLGAVPPEHPLYIGLLGMHGARYTNMVLDECDLLLVAGARFDDRATGKTAGFCPNARSIHVDIDPSEHRKIRHAESTIVGDVGTVFDALREQADPASAALRLPWLERVRALKAAYPLHTPDAQNLHSAYGIIKKVAEIVGEEAVIATDVGQHQMRTAQFYPLRRPRGWLTSGGQGTMGFGLPAAIGAALAQPERTVVCFSGDGSLLMNIQEMATAAEQGVNVKIILANNSGLGLIQQMQDLLFDGRVFAWNYTRPVDFIRIAQGFGLETLDLGTSPRPEDDLRELLTRPGPALINLPLAATDNVYPVVPPGAANTHMIGD